MNNYILTAILLLFLFLYISNIFSYRKEDGYVLSFISLRNLVYFFITVLLVLNINELTLKYKSDINLKTISLNDKALLIDMTKTEKSKAYLKEKFIQGINKVDMREVRFKIGELNKI